MNWFIFKVSSVKQEILSLANRVSHPNLTHYLAVNVQETALTVKVQVKIIKNVRPFYLRSILFLIILVDWVCPCVQVLLPFFSLETVIIFLRTIFPLYLQVLVEYVGGGDLSLRLRSGGLPLEQLREYTQQLVEALTYLHGKAVVHKDLRVSQWSAIQADVMPGETWNLYGF